MLRIILIISTDWMASAGLAFKKKDKEKE